MTTSPGRTREQPAFFATLTSVALVGLVGCVNALDTSVTAAADAHDDDDTEVTVQGGALDGVFRREGDLLVSSPVALPGGVNRIAVMLDAAEPIGVLARGLADDARSPFVDVGWTFAEDGLHAGAATLSGVWDAVEVAVPADRAAAIVRLTFSAVLLDDVVDDDEVGATVVAPPEQALHPALAFVGVIPRAAWGARPHRCSTRDGSFSRVALHHTASRWTGNPEAMIRQAQAYHLDGRGYCDIAYHFAVAQDGRIFELRPLPLRGGHTLNNNTSNVGVVFLGCFDGACGGDRPTEALLRAGAGLVRMMQHLYGIPIDADRVRGHRDHAGQSTSCPGGFLHPRLEEIRARARAMGAAPPPPPPPTAPPTAPGPAGCGVIASGQGLLRNQSVTSCDGRSQLVHQADGNVVLYEAGQAIWATHTAGQDTALFAMQADGNVVLYAPGGRAVWHTATHGNAGAGLVVQDDRNVVVYGGGRVLWHTNTWRR
jgi:hypothetical protein